MASAHSLEGLMKWLRRAEWRETFEEVLDWHLGPACTKAGVAVDELPSLLDAQDFSVLWGCVFEDALASELDDGRNIVDDYVKRRGWTESAANRNYMLALRSSVMSLYEISDIVLEESFLARDLIRGSDPVRVTEKSGTRSLKPWDRIAARIVPVGSMAEMAGGALPFDHETSEDVLKSMREAGRMARAEAAEKARESGTPISEAMTEAIAEAFSDTEILRASAFVFTNAWLGNRLRQLLKPLVPELFNSDGEPLTSITVHYPLAATATAASVQKAVAAIPTFRAESEVFWNWIGPQNRLGRKRPTEGRMLVTTLDDGSLVLGTIELKDEALTLTVNSEARLQRGRALLEPALAGLASAPLIERQTIEQLLASPSKNVAKLSSGLSPADERAIIHEAMTDHYRRMLDEPVTPLGDATPRRAVKTKRGREKVIAWLKLLENDAAHHPPNEPMAGYDFGWLWQELGIADQRR